MKKIDSHQTIELDSSAMFVYIRTMPHAEISAGSLERMKKFLQTGPNLPKLSGETKYWDLDRDRFIFEMDIPGVFAEGDVPSGANRRIAMQLVKDPREFIWCKNNYKRYNHTTTVQCAACVIL